METKMTIKEKQTTNIGKDISYIYRRNAEILSRKLKEIEISSVQSIIMVCIYRNPEINQRLLANELSIDTATTSKQLRTLENNNYVYKVTDEENRRNFKLYLTEKGLEKTKESLALQKKYWYEILSDFSEDEICELQKLLMKMEHNVRQYEEQTEK